MMTEIKLLPFLDEQKMPKTDDELIIDIFSTGEFSIMDHIKKYDNKKEVIIWECSNVIIGKTNSKSI